MESHAEGLKENSGNTLDAKMAELVKTKEELKRAKDNAMQSWLDSKPLIDELERLKAELASAKNRYSMSNMIVSELQSELDTTTNSIVSKKEEEAKAAWSISELSQALDETREELETLKLATQQERRARSKLKLVLTLKRQKLRATQLRLRATRKESEAFGASAAEALRCVGISETDSNVTVQMSREEYRALKRKVKEEASLAAWRISVSIEQKQAAEASRDLALSRLKEKNRLKRTSTMSTEEEKITGHEETTAAAREMAVVEQELNIKADQAAEENRGFAFPKARAKLINAESSRGKSQQKRESKSNHNNNRNLMGQKGKASFFHRIKDFIVRSITRLLG